jgi:hypothetical protein
MYSVVLQSADHLETGAVAYMRQPRIAMPAEIPLQNPAVAGAIEKSAPRFQFVDARRSFLGVQFRHAPIIQILAAAHRVGEVNSPAVSVVNISHRRRYAAFRHYGVRFAQQGFRNHRNLYARGRSLDGGAQASASRPNN